MAETTEKRAGLISLNVSNSSACISQARASKARHKANYALVVSNNFPRGQRYLCVVRDVLVVHPTILTHVVRYVRQALILAARSTSTPIERQRKADRLFEFMRTPDFGESMNTVAEALTDLRDPQDEEQAAHRRTWQHQAARFDVIDNTTPHLQTRIDAILGGIEVAALPEEAAAG